MSSMSYAGSSLIVTWTSGTASLALSGDFRTFTYTPSLAFYDATSGSDTAVKRITGLADGAASFSGVMGTTGPGGLGTTPFTFLREGAVGTIVAQPEGTAAGKPKLTIPCLSLGIKWNIPYNNVVEYSVDFQQNSARTDGTN